MENGFARFADPGNKGIDDWNIGDWNDLLVLFTIRMKRFDFIFYLTILSLAGWLTGCSEQRVIDPNPGTPTRYRVNTITQELPDNVAKVSVLRYDAQGRLSTIKTYQTPDSTVAEVMNSVYLYDAQNRLTQLRRERIPYPRSQSGPNNAVEQYIYLYNESGLVSQIQYINGLSWSYTYDANKQLVSSSGGYSHPRFSIQGAIQYTFTGKNLTKTTGGTGIRYQGMPSGMSSDFPGITSATYTHDDKINPFYGTSVIPSALSGFVNILYGPTTPNALFGGTDNVLTLSQNNVLSETPEASTRETITYQYQYNTANLPTLRIKTITAPAPNGTVTKETVRFEYESY